MTAAADGDRRRGAVIRPSRGRVIVPPRGAAAPASRRSPAPISASVGQGVQFPVLLGLLVLFGQSFQYVNDLPPAYLLTKAWPLLMLPLAAWAAAGLRLAYRPILLLALVCALGLAPLMGVLVLGNGLVGAMASTAKVWPLLNGFSMAAVLVLLRPAPSVLLRGILWLGAITLAAFVVLALAAPDSAYHQALGATKIFMWDQDRGNRLYLPMFFGFLSLFALVRSLRQRPAVWKLLLVCVAYAVLVLLYKQRTPILASVLVIAVGWALERSPWRKPKLAVLVAAGLLGSIPVTAYLTSSMTARLLGGSLTARQLEAAAAAGFLNDGGWRWLTGVGSATRIGNVDFGDIVGAAYFYLADLGWLGVIFEYGLLGAGVLLLLGLSGLRQAARPSTTAPLLGAIAYDYVLFFLVSTVTMPIVFAPGELMFCMALTAYLARLDAERAGRGVGAAEIDPGPAGGSPAPPTSGQGLGRLWPTRRGRYLPSIRRSSAALIVAGATRGRLIARSKLVNPVVTSRAADEDRPLDEFRYLTDGGLTYIEFDTLPSRADPMTSWPVLKQVEQMTVPPVAPTAEAPTPPAPQPTRQLPLDQVFAHLARAAA